MYYYTYKITCLVGSWKGKFYFGQHKTEKLDDNYITGGKKIKCYIKKYPNGYKREILAFYNSQEELNKAEYDLIHPWLNNEMCLNMRDGGYKPNLGDEQKTKITTTLLEYYSNPENRKKAGEKNIGKPAWNKGMQTSDETRKKQSDSKKEYYKTHNAPNKDVPCKEETKHKIRKKLKGGKRSLESRKKQGETTKGHVSYIKGKHKVWDNKELNKFHYEL